MLIINCLLFETWKNRFIRRRQDLLIVSSLWQFLNNTIFNAINFVKNVIFVIKLNVMFHCLVYFSVCLDYVKPIVFPNAVTFTISPTHVNKLCSHIKYTLIWPDHNLVRVPNCKFRNLVYLETHINYSFHIKNNFIDFFKFIINNTSFVFKTRL